MARAEAKYVISAQDRTKRATDSAKRNLRGLADTARNTLGPLMAVAGAAGLIALGKSAIEAADNIHKLSLRIGASTEALSQYQYVAEVSGVSFRTMAMGWQRMTRRVSEAAVGMGEARAALKELRLDAVKLNQLAPEQQFEVLADAIMGFGNSADRVRLAMKMFDSEGVALIQMMKGGSKEIRRLKKEIDDLGGTLTKEQAEAAAEAANAFEKLGSSFKAIAKNVAVELAPAMTAIANFLAVELPKVDNRLAQMLAARDKSAQDINSVWNSFNLWIAKQANTNWFSKDKPFWPDPPEKLIDQLPLVGSGFSTAAGRAARLAAEVALLDTAIVKLSGNIDGHAQWWGVMNDVYEQGHQAVTKLAEGHASLFTAMDQLYVEGHNRAADGMADVASAAENMGQTIGDEAAAGAGMMLDAIAYAVNESTKLLEALGNIAKSVFFSILGILLRIGIGTAIPGAIGDAINPLKSMPGGGGGGGGGASIPGPDKAGGITVIINSNGDIFTDPLVKRRVAEELGDEINRAQLAIGPA